MGIPKVKYSVERVPESMLLKGLKAIGKFIMICIFGLIRGLFLMILRSLWLFLLLLMCLIACFVLLFGGVQKTGGYLKTCSERLLTSKY